MLIHVYSGTFGRKKLLIKNDVLAVSDVVVLWLSEGVIKYTFPGSSPASPHIRVFLLQELCSFPTSKSQTISLASPQMSSIA